MSAPSVLIAGCGDVGSRLAEQMLAKGWQVYGLRRNISRLPVGVIGIAGDLFSEQCPVDWPTGPLDYLVYCVAASQHDEAGYRAAYVDGLRRVLGWLAERFGTFDRVLGTLNGLVVVMVLLWIGYIVLVAGARKDAASLTAALYGSLSLTCDA